MGKCLYSYGAPAEIKSPNNKSNEVPRKAFSYCMCMLECLCKYTSEMKITAISDKGNGMGHKQGD